MFREEPKEKVPLHLMAGYVPGLHQRNPGDAVCITCEYDWPCDGAQRQLKDAARFTNPFWLDDARHEAIKAQMIAMDTAEAERKAARKVKAAEAAEAAKAAEAAEAKETAPA